jgi:Ca-activated chloride channel homolog
MRLMKVFPMLILSVGLMFSVVAAQDKKTDEEDEPLRIDTQLVDVPFVVTDKSGKPLLNLKKDNFVVYEDGKPQEIMDFNATAAPFEIALLLDTSGSTRADLPLIQRAAENFIASLRPGDRVSIIAYESRIKDNRSTSFSEVLSNLTDDRAKLKNVLAGLTTSNGTPYYDSLVQIIETVFNEQPKDEFRGRRALVALTDGVDSTSLSDFTEARELLVKAGIVSYFIQIDTRTEVEDRLLGDCSSETIRFSKAQLTRYYRTFPAKSNVEKIFDFCALGDFERLAVSKRLYELANLEMNTLAQASGGKVFPVADLSEARNAFKMVADEIGTKYSIGYYPSNDKRDGTYRKIKIELKGVPAGTTIRAREGYTAPAN